MNDILIIGTGVAATCLAQNILRKNPTRSVILIEVGEKLKTKDFATWANFLVKDELPYEKCYDLDYPSNNCTGENQSSGGTTMPLNGSRIFSMGGASLHWGGWSFRLKPEDFNLYSNTGKGLDWPIKYEDLEKYYCLAEAYLGVSGDSKSTNPPRSKDYPFPEFPYTNQDRNLALAFEKLNISHENLPIARRNVAQSESRHAPCQTTGTCKYCPFGAKYVATDYLNDMVNYGNHPNLKIHTGLYAEKILMSSKNRAIGIRTKSRVDGQSVDIYAHTIIVSSGAIEAAKLLQRSTSSEWASGIGNDNGLVGKFLISHPFFSFSAILNENKDALLPEMDFPTLCSRHFDSPEEQSMMKFILLNPPHNPNIHLASLMKEGLPTKEIQQKIKGKCRIKLDGMLESFPYEYNQIENLNIKNRFGMFQTKVTYTSDPKFDFRVNQIQGEVEKIFKAMGAQSTGEFTVSLRADHASSLTRMSNSCESGVVDENLKVHGVDNLFVCSNSVFPSGGSVNPTLTLVALSIRLSEHLCK